MLPKLREARYQGDYRIWLCFDDGSAGEIDLESELWGEVFEPLKDRSVFETFVLDHELGTIVWSNGADFAPEFLYERLRPGRRPKSTPESGVA
jgi:hypothetical protein